MKDYVFVVESFTNLIGRGGLTRQVFTRDASILQLNVRQFIGRWCFLLLFFIMIHYLIDLRYSDLKQQRMRKSFRIKSSVITQYGMVERYNVLFVVNCGEGDLLCVSCALITRVRSKFSHIL